MHPRALILSAVVATIAAPSAHAFTALNQQFVRQGPGGTIEVHWRGESGAPAFWCAAGDFAIRSLHLPQTTRLYRISEAPRPLGEPMLFSLSPEGAVDSGLIILEGDTHSQSASAAQDLCR